MQHPYTRIYTDTYEHNEHTDYRKRRSIITGRNERGFILRVEITIRLLMSWIKPIGIKACIRNALMRWMGIIIITIKCWHNSFSHGTFRWQNYYHFLLINFVQEIERRKIFSIRPFCYEALCPNLTIKILWQGFKNTFFQCTRSRLCKIMSDSRTNKNFSCIPWTEENALASRVLWLNLSRSKYWTNYPVTWMHDT